MSDDAKPLVPAEPAPRDPTAKTSPRRRRGVLRAYVETWLLSSFVGCAFTLMWHLGEVAEGRKGADSILGAFLVAPIVALLGLPALWLLLIFRERSPSTWLRFLRRIVLGAICGAFPAALLAALTARKDGSEAGNALVLWTFGVVFGVVAGFVDAMHLDVAATRDALADDDLA